jgi:hypothetical protein
MTNQTVYLDRKDVPAAIRGSYTGNKFKVVVTESMTIPADAGLWSGGSRDHYQVVELFSAERRSAPNQHLDPWTSARQDRKIELRDGFAVVEHSIFCGKDMGLTIYINANHAAALLPAPVELSADEQFVLQATRQYKSSYNGLDRYQLATQYNFSGKVFPTREAYNAAREALIAAGFLNKAGALTTKGKNAAQ